MKNIEHYFNWHYIILVFFMLLCIFALIESSVGYLFVMVPLMVPVGLVQIITAIGYTLEDSLPEYFQSDWRTYWIITVFYFLILMLIYQSDVTKEIYQIWLFGMPWFIVCYQFNLVSRIYKWRLSNQGDLQHQLHSKS